MALTALPGLAQSLDGSTSLVMQTEESRVSTGRGKSCRACVPNTTRRMSYGFVQQYLDRLRCDWLRLYTGSWLVDCRCR